MRKKLPDSSIGTSLIEVLIAIVILGVVGGVLFNGLLVNRKTSDKVSVNVTAFTQVDSAAQLIAAATYKACNRLQANPYENLSLPDRVTITSVEGMTKQGTWVACGDSTWSTQRSIMQRIRIKAPYTDNPDGTFNTGASAKYVKRTLFKSFPSGTYASNYSVKISTAGGLKSSYDYSMGPIPGPGGWSDEFTLSVENQTSSCFEVLQADYTTDSTFAPVLSNPCGPSPTTIKVRLPAAAITGTPAIAPGAYNIDIGAYNIDNGDVAAPASLRIIVKPTLQVSTSIINYIGTTGTTGTTCTKFKTTKATATVAYCLVKMLVVPGTGSSSGIELSVDAGCRVKAFFGATAPLTQTYVRCSFAPPFATTSQTTWGSETTTVDLYLWKETATGTAAETTATSFCNGTSTSATNKNNSITIELYDRGLSSPYRKLITLPSITVTCT